MEIHTPSNNKFKKSLNKINNTEEKEKLVYKFKIFDNNPKLHNYAGKYYLINLNNINKQISLQKNGLKLKNLPPIKIKDEIKFTNTLEYSKERNILDNEKYNNTEDNRSKTVSKIFISLSPKKCRNQNNNTIGHKSISTLTESFNFNFEKKKQYYENIIKKINDRYFVKKSTMKYLSTLFYDPYEARDIKYVNLSRIKDKKKIEINNYNDKQKRNKNNLFRINRNLHRKKININVINSVDEKYKDNYNDPYKLNKSNLVEKLKNLKIKKSKELVNNAINDVLTTRRCNQLYFDKIRKDCDYNYNEIGISKYSE